MAATILAIVIMLMAGIHTSSSECSDYCFPGMSCYPSLETVADLIPELDGNLTDSIFYPLSPQYYNISIMKNLLYTRFPAYIVMARSVQDVQQAILFARKYNLKVSIQSSGHDYIGRSTGDGTFMINLSLMKGIDIDLNSPLNADGVIRCESGNNWARVYEKLDKYDRVVVGGSAHTVAMGGYTLGGGHSPMARTLGLAVDNLLEVTMVTADGAIVNVSASGSVSVSADGKVTHSSDPDLFWALRGGGGGTYGVVTSFVYKLHKPPSSFSRVLCEFRYNIYTERQKASDFVKYYFDLAKTLPNEWGGYYIGSFDLTYPYDHAYYLVAMLHYGPSNSSTFSKIHPLMDYDFNNQQIKCSNKDFTTFWDYEQSAKDTLYTRSALVTSFVSPDDFGENMADWIRDITMTPPTNTSIGSCTNTLIGGKVSTVADDDTAVSHNFRAALGSLSCGLGWADNPTLDVQNLKAAEQLEEKLQKLGHGVYINEPPAKMKNWKHDFWGNHYARLLRVKEQWDPTNFLTCLYCVGSDLGRNYGRSGANIIG